MIYRLMAALAQRCVARRREERRRDLHACAPFGDARAASRASCAAVGVQRLPPQLKCSRPHGPRRPLIKHLLTPSNQQY